MTETVDVIYKEPEPADFYEGHTQSVHIQLVNVVFFSLNDFKDSSLTTTQLNSSLNRITAIVIK